MDVLKIAPNAYYIPLIHKLQFTTLFYTWLTSETPSELNGWSIIWWYMRLRVESFLFFTIAILIENAAYSPCNFVNSWGDFVCPIRTIYCIVYFHLLAVTNRQPANSSFAVMSCYHPQCPGTETGLCPVKEIHLLDEMLNQVLDFLWSLKIPWHSSQE